MRSERVAAAHQQSPNSGLGNTISLQVRMRFIRGCEIEGYLDEEGRVVQEGFEKPKYKTRMRTVRVYLDVNQYQVLFVWS